MTRLLRLLVLGTGLLVVVAVVVGLFMPRSWSVECTRVLRAPQERVQAELLDLRNWEHWTPWSRTRDETLVVTFDGPATGVGSRMSWEGQRLGFGSLTLTAAHAGVEYEIAFRGVDQRTRGALALAPDPAGVRITWRDGGELGWNPIMRLFAPLFEAKLAQDFGAGLGRLALRVEAAH
ncbi:MAG: SRPBCC family protein [Planctomycetes bacterium]|nr:SRPBCC family protein [Planctomycetota bacterium]